MSSSWWFGAFREHGAPTWYGENRTPVIADITTVKVAVLFGIFLVAFLVIFPGIRRAKWTSFVSIVMALVVGALLIISTYYPSWHVAEVWIFSPYKSFSSYRVNALLGVNVGLKYVNITLKGFPENEKHRQMDYNERFAFYEVKSMQNDLREGLNKGLPYPILSVIEYFSVDKAGFIWGRRYRLAGYYTCILLWLSFALWLLHLLILCLIPQFYSRILMCLGICILLADGVYVMACPKSLYIPFTSDHGATQRLIFEFGWCLWSTLGAGFSCFTYAVVIRILESKSDYKFNTFLQFDSDNDLYCKNGVVVLDATTSGLSERRFDEQRPPLPSSEPTAPELASCALGLDQFIDDDEPSPNLSVRSRFSFVLGNDERYDSTGNRIEDPLTLKVADSQGNKSWSSESSRHNHADDVVSKLADVPGNIFKARNIENNIEEPVDSLVHFSLIVEEDEEAEEKEGVIENGEKDATSSNGPASSACQDSLTTDDCSRRRSPEISLPLSSNISSFDGSLINLGFAPKKNTECIRRPSTKVIRRRSSHLNQNPYLTAGGGIWCDETAENQFPDSSSGTGSGSGLKKKEPQRSEFIDLSFPGFDDDGQRGENSGGCDGKDKELKSKGVFPNSVLTRRVGGVATVARSASKLQRRASNPVSMQSAVLRRPRLDSHYVHRDF